MLMVTSVLFLVLTFNTQDSLPVTLTHLKTVRLKEKHFVFHNWPVKLKHVKVRKGIIHL